MPVSFQLEISDREAELLENIIYNKKRVPPSVQIFFTTIFVPFVCVFDTQQVEGSELNYASLIQEITADLAESMDFPLFLTQHIIC